MYKVKIASGTIKGILIVVLTLIYLLNEFGMGPSGISSIHLLANLYIALDFLYLVIRISSCAGSTMQKF
jgi:hypothetical protein